MISPATHFETVTTKVYEIAAPATWKDVSDTIRQIQQDPHLVKGDYDDAVMVHCGDDVLRFVFEVSSVATQQHPDDDRQRDALRVEFA